MKVSDEELVGIIKERPDPMQSSETALLISRYSRVIRIKAAKLHTSDTDPEDLCQEGYLALFDAVRAYDGTKGLFSAFAGRCIENRMKNAVLKGRGKLEKDEDFDVTLIADESAAAEDYVITKENDDEIVEMLLSHLTEKEYNVLKLYIDGYSYKQIAEKMDISVKSADNALSRARKKLRELLL